MEKRVKELKERPEALAALNGMLNQSSFFLDSIKNLSSVEIEDKVFTDVEIEILEKLINETEVGHMPMLWLFCIFIFTS
jgi:hypoxia up-regulated 1